MVERPVLFSAPMVRALLAGRKTQTRRLLTPQPGSFCSHVEEFRGEGGGWIAGDNSGRVFRCPFGLPGDRLWVRETWSPDCTNVYPCPKAWYRATNDVDGFQIARHADCEPPLHCKHGPSAECWAGFHWRPSIHMPRWASRILLEITEVRVQRLQEISEEDARAEGVVATDAAVVFQDRRRIPALEMTYRGAFACLWDSINAKRSPWARNDWVWALGLKVVEVRR